MKWQSRHPVDPTSGVDIGRRLAATWRGMALRIPMSLRRRQRVSIVAFAAALLVGLSALLLVAGPRFARAGTAAVAAAPGTPYVWGLNGNGELGTGSTNTCSGYPCSNTPLALNVLTNVKALVGSVYAWGDNSSGQLGVTTQQTCYGQPCSPIPLQVTGIPAIAAVAAGEFHSLALTTTGAGYAWGNNTSGQLGSTMPIQVSGLSSVSMGSSLPNGSSFTVTLVVTVTIRSGTLADTASVSAGTPDPNSANNSASVSTSVVKH
ncbi:MAG TPA: hypothetical protein VGS80_00480 [Ktedonobacterales bacterium]|nr:hypothetical protein [Ktedonobacterales bacterium]